jgi:ADP-ribose pyrophosphatase
MSERTRGGRALETEAFARISHEAVFSGHYLQVSVDRFRYPDGREANREIVDGGDVVVVCAYDKEGVFLVGQPREAAGEALLWELPAGAVDTADKEILEAAQRELAEEIGKGAHHWELVRTFYSSR